MIYLLEASANNWSEILKGALGAGGVLTLIIFILGWIRYNKKDTVDVHKGTAEVSVLQAQAAEIKSKADGTVADLAMKIAQDLRVEAAESRKQLEKTQLELEKAVETCRMCTINLEVLQKELDKERAINEERTQKINSLTSQLDKLQASINGK